MTDEREGHVTIAKITKTRGLRGEVVAHVLTDFPERFDGLVDVIALLPNGTRRDLKIEEHRFQKGRAVLKFAGFDTIESAEELRDAEVAVPESEAVELEDDTFFQWQIEGCSVETIEGKPLGTVTGILRTGAADVLTVNSGVTEYLIPFAEAICVEVDIENKIIRVDPPEGLLEF
ncbi:MAG: 16S rRNA processing protein RimM [Blastocatellia bacterium]|nr:16S rRNA processing protein RimM [Blastocatellia bacterium]